MASIARRVETTYVLELTQSEADWLGEVMQNPLYNELPAEENLKSKQIRTALFDCLRHRNREEIVNES